MLATCFPFLFCFPILIASILAKNNYLIISIVLICKDYLDTKQGIKVFQHFC